jgi:hypothetical protein
MLLILREQQTIQHSLRRTFHPVLGFNALNGIFTTWGCVSLHGQLRVLLSISLPSLLMND